MTEKGYWIVLAVGLVVVVFLATNLGMELAGDERSGLLISLLLISLAVFTAVWLRMLWMIGTSHD